LGLPGLPGIFSESKTADTRDRGKHDPFFIPAGAEAYRRDNSNATVQILDTGHLALETHVEEIARAMKAIPREER
jgi:pimeloyl-ACP methyl ester carboxylesterase